MGRGKPKRAPQSTKAQTCACRRLCDAKAVKTADNAIVDYEWCINGKTTYESVAGLMTMHWVTSIWTVAYTNSLWQRKACSLSPLLNSAIKCCLLLSEVAAAWPTASFWTFDGRIRTTYEWSTWQQNTPHQTTTERRQLGYSSTPTAKFCKSPHRVLHRTRKSDWRGHISADLWEFQHENNTVAAHSAALTLTENKNTNVGNQQTPLV